MRLQQLRTDLVPNFSHICVWLQLCDIKNQLARQRISIGVKPCRWQHQQRIAQLYILTRQNILSLDRSDNKSCKIVFADRIKSRHLRRLSADQRASCFAASARHSFDKLLDHIRIELPHRKVIEKKQWLRTLHKNVVHAVIDEISAHGRVNACRHRHFQLCPNAIRTRHKHRIRILALVQRKQRAESPDSSQHPLCECPACMMANALFRRVGYGDVDPCVSVFHGYGKVPFPCPVDLEPAVLS